MSIESYRARLRLYWTLMRRVLLRQGYGGRILLCRMRMRGVEPPRPEGHRHLKPARLPIPPHPQGFQFCKPQRLPSPDGAAGVLSARWSLTNTSLNGFRHLVNNFIELCPVRDSVLRRRKVSPREFLTGFALLKQSAAGRLPTCASQSSTNLFGVRLGESRGRSGVALIE